MKNKILPKEIHVWVIDLRDYLFYLENFYTFLHENERQRASRYKFDEHRQYFILARGILRKILSSYLSMEPNQVEFNYNPYGKPYLNCQLQNNALFFNLSHAEDIVLYIFSYEFELGIDVEKVGYFDSFESIAAQFFSLEEYLALQSIPAPDRLTAFFKCWTRKEAFVKAIGKGLAYPFKQFEVSLKPDQPAAVLKINGDPHLASPWSLYSLNTVDHYEAAFAFKGNCEGIKIMMNSNIENVMI